MSCRAARISLRRTEAYHNKYERSQTRKWHFINGNKMIVGKLAQVVAPLLSGKYKPNHIPSVDSGDYVVVTNVDKLTFTNERMYRKVYRWHTHNYAGGLHTMPAIRWHLKHPERLLFAATKRMLPHNSLRGVRLSRLRCYSGGTHPHQAQEMFSNPDVTARILSSRRVFETEERTGPASDIAFSLWDHPNFIAMFANQLDSDPAKANQDMEAFMKEMKEQETLVDIYDTDPDDPDFKPITTVAMAEETTKGPGKKK